MYRRLVRILDPLRVVTKADGVALELAASALVEYEAHVGVVFTHGATYEATTAAGAVMHRARPEQAIAADAWRRAAAMLQQFGMTPAARPKVEAMLPTEPDALEAFRAAHGRGGHARDPMRQRSKWGGLLS